MQAIPNAAWIRLERVPQLEVFQDSGVTAFVTFLRDGTFIMSMLPPLHVWMLRPRGEEAAQCATS